MPLHSFEVKLTKEQSTYIAQKVWQNEGAGLDKYLIHWNKGEDFASVGIGHFIWFSKGHKERFREVFPILLKFMENRDVSLPLWLNSKTDLPWNNKKEFLKAKENRSKKYRELFYFLKSTTSYQADFMVQRLNNALPKILSTINSYKRAQIIKNRFYNIIHNKNGSIDEQGIYVLLDYTNFKGEGTLKSERYNNQGWGLSQVLENINPNIKNKIKAFALSAKEILSRRIKNSPAKRGEERWRKGWNVRLDRYWK